MLITNRSSDLLSDQIQTLFKRSPSSRVTIATAYISPGACQRIDLLSEAIRREVRIVVGRALFDGLAEQTTSYLARLEEETGKRGGGVRIHPAGFHSKIYAGEGISIIGSSNLTEHGLSDWAEANILLEGSHAELVATEANSLYEGAVTFSDIRDSIRPIRVAKAGRGKAEKVEIPSEPGSSVNGLSISLLSNDGGVPEKSGLNWGHGGGRPRNPFECYIRFPVSVHEAAKFIFGSADRETVFTAKTHDGQTLRLLLGGNSRKGEREAKQIISSGRMAILGEWLVRDCLGITAGRLVTKQDLELYGRTDVDFYRIGTEPDGSAIVYMDFSPEGIR